MTVTLAMRGAQHVTGCSLHCQWIVFLRRRDSCREGGAIPEIGGNKTVTIALRRCDNWLAYERLRSEQLVLLCNWVPEDEFDGHPKKG
jgi:hypothetical protein